MKFYPQAVSAVPKAFTTVVGLCLWVGCSAAQAVTLTAPVTGTFTMALDAAELANYYGYRLTSYWDTAASDYSNPLNTGNGLVGQIGITEISASNQVFELTPVGFDPTNQAAQRFVKATSSNFSLDSETLTGVAGAQIGMTGVQGFYAPLWPPAGGGVVNGDFSVNFDTARKTDGRTGWYLANNIFFTMAVYELNNLNLVHADASNWQLSGDLLMSPENGGMLQGASLNKVGSFCLGAGAYSGCAQGTVVPVPAPVWLLGSGVLAMTGWASRKRHVKGLNSKIGR